MTEQGIDLHKFDTPAVIKKAPAISGSAKVQSALLKELDGIVISESIERQEKKVKELVIKGMIADGEDMPEELNIKFIDRGVFAFRGKNKDIIFFTNGEGKNLINIHYLRKNIFVERGDIFNLTGYTEKFENGEHKLYKKGSDKPINQNSTEYLKTRQEIGFTDDIFTIQVCIEKKIPFSKKAIVKYVNKGVLKFENLEELKNNELIKDNDFKFGIDLIKQNIVKQCQDIRLIDHGIGIKESDLKKYTENKSYGIAPELALECYKVLPDVMRDLSIKK